MAASKCPPCKKGAPAYMLTFGDLMSLLLTFFIMLLTMASFEPIKYAMTVQSLQGAFGVLESFPTVAIMPIVKIPKFGDADEQRKQSQEDAIEFQEEMKEKSLDDAVKVKVTETGIAVLLADPLTFAIGSDKMNPKTLPILQAVAKLIERDPNSQIRVEGHTDDVPIKSAKFPSNWELSAARALKIIKKLSEYSAVNPGNLSAVGYGQHRPLVPNTSKENRAKNRRIEIYIDYTQKK